MSHRTKPWEPDRAGRGFHIGVSQTKAKRGLASPLSVAHARRKGLTQRARAGNRGEREGGRTKPTVATGLL